MSTLEDEELLIRSYGSQTRGNMGSPGQNERSFTGEREDSELLIPNNADVPKSSQWIARIIKNEELRDHLKPFLASVLLTILGIACIVVGIVVTIWPVGVHAWVFLFAGSICLIPGAYHLGYIICILRGREGYTWDSLRTLS